MRRRRDLDGPELGAERSEETCEELATAGLAPRMHDALTDLHAYVLVLDAEWQRLGDRVDELAQSDVPSPDRVDLERRRAEITEELDALRSTIAALRARADPAGDLL
jgi:hypothetical protein